MGFEHGNNPTNATYQYVLLPGRSAARVGQYAAQPQVSVITNNANVQAASETRLGITAANFWTDTTQTAGGITANKKCSVMVRNDGTFIDVAVSDPTQAIATSEYVVVPAVTIAMAAAMREAVAAHWRATWACDAAVGAAIVAAADHAALHLIDVAAGTVDGVGGWPT